jgi:hypothetical protein
MRHSLCEVVQRDSMVQQSCHAGTSAKVDSFQRNPDAPPLSKPTLQGDPSHVIRDGCIWEALGEPRVTGGGREQVVQLGL